MCEKRAESGYSMTDLKTRLAVLLASPEGNAMIEEGLRPIAIEASCLARPPIFFAVRESTTSFAAAQHLFCDRRFSRHASVRTPLKGLRQNKR
jgi:hypothetical protein